MSEQAEISMDQSDSDIAQRIGNLISSEPPKQAFPPAPQEREEQEAQQEEQAPEQTEEQEAAPAQGEPDEFEWEWEGEKYVLPKVPAVWWMTIPPGLIITAILVVNNLRDIENDRKAGKHTLAVRLGEKGTKVQYLVCMVIAYFVLIPVAWAGMIPWAAMLAWLSLPLAIQAAKVVWTQKGRPLNAALAKTGQTALFFSLLFWVGLLFS